MPSYTYNGVTVTATARRTSTRDDKKYMRTVTKDGKDYLVHYGDPDMEMKRDDPDRRKAFLERHSCSTKKDPLAPGFWACLDWQRTDEGATVNEEATEPTESTTVVTESVADDAPAPWTGDRTDIAVNTACGCNTMQLTTNATAGTVQEVTRKGKRYLVAPAVALKSGVLNGEFVPADEVAKYANAWNGRPVPIGHPKQGGQAISANSMDLWDETPAMFWDAHIDGDALKGNIWLDIDKAADMGGDGARLLQRLRNNEAIDVSTGYFRDLVDQPGTHDGEAYTGIARNLRPDHIAILLNETGACSWADGCGVPRINEAKAAETASQSFISALVRNVLTSLGGKKVDRNTIIEGLVANAQCKCSKPQLEAMDDATLSAFAESLQPVVNEESPTVEPVQVEVIKEVVPAELAQLVKAVADFGGVEKLTSALSGLAANANKERADLVAGLVANERNTLDEAELQALPIETLRKLTSAFAPRTYVGGGALVATNATEEPRYTTMAMPSIFSKKEAK
jgi:hypothetical protein